MFVFHFFSSHVRADGRPKVSAEVHNNDTYGTEVFELVRLAGFDTFACLFGFEHIRYVLSRNIFSGSFEETTIKEYQTI